MLNSDQPIRKAWRLGIRSGKAFAAILRTCRGCWRARFSLTPPPSAPGTVWLFPDPEVRLPGFLEPDALSARRRLAHPSARPAARDSVLGHSRCRRSSPNLAAVPNDPGDAVFLFARLGGHLKRKRDPPEVMWNGYAQLAAMAHFREIEDEPEQNLWGTGSSSLRRRSSACWPASCAG